MASVARTPERNVQRRRILTALILLAFLTVCVAWLLDRTRLAAALRRLPDDAEFAESRLASPDRRAALVTKQARFGKTQILEYLLHTDGLFGKPIPDYPPICQLADGTFDDSQAPALWQKARNRYPGTKCIGYYFSLDEDGKVDAGLRGPAFFVLTVDGKLAWWEDNVGW